MLSQEAPAWMVDFVAFRKRLFLRVVEPVIVGILGPVEEQAAASYHEEISPFAFRGDSESNSWNSSSAMNSSVLFDVEEATIQHRRLGFLPDYVEDASSFRETSMSFATLITLFITMASILLIFLSCFYHNQKCVLVGRQ